MISAHIISIRKESTVMFRVSNRNEGTSETYESDVTIALAPIERRKAISNIYTEKKHY